MFTTYSEAIHYLYTNLPVFQQIGATAYKPDLTNTLKLCQALDNPQTKFKTIHVAGTNGKGSTSHMLASVLQSAGYKTGLYTSPHLKDFTERIRINGIEIEKDFVIDFVNRIRPQIEAVKPSFFEITVAMAFDYFAKHNIEVAIIEAGLGGRLDSTNVILPILSVITNIGWDHMDLLGNTLQMIASEKAGIIKAGVSVIVSERQQEVEQVFIDKARLENAPLFFATDDYKVSAITNSQGLIALNVHKKSLPLFDNLILPLQGIYQQKNLAGILKTVDLLTMHGFVVSKNNLLDGLKNVISNTSLRGRWQKLGDKPLIICDTGHNADGMKMLVKQIEMQTYNVLHIVLGMVKDKDLNKVLALLPKHAKYYFCQAKIPRALNANALAQKAQEFNLQGVIFNDVNQAIENATAMAKPNDFIFIGGSTFVVAEIENL